MALTLTQINQIYVSYFGRPADAAGVAYYQSVDATPSQVGAAFAASAESLAYYGDLSVWTLVGSIYRNLFDRNADFSGQAYWSSEISNGRLTLADAALAIGNAARDGDLARGQAQDRSTVFNKVIAANAFTAAIDTPAEASGYAGAAAAQAGRAYLAGVKGTSASLEAALAQAGAQVSRAVEAGVEASRVTDFTLSPESGQEALTGTAGRDLFVADDRTFVAGESIDGGAGVDTLQWTGATAPAGTVRNVEIIDIASTAAVESHPGGIRPVSRIVLDAAAFAGAALFNSSPPSSQVPQELIVDNLAAGQRVGFVGSRFANNGIITANYAADVAAVVVDFRDGVGGGLRLTGAGITDLTVNSTGYATNSFGLGIPDSVSSLRIQADAALEFGVGNTFRSPPQSALGLRSVTIAGAAGNVQESNDGLGAKRAVNIGGGTDVLPDSVESIDASGLTNGGVRLGYLPAGILSFKGGQGNDTVWANDYTRAAASSIDGGAGSGDVLFLIFDDFVDTAAKAGVYANFEVLHFVGRTVDVSLFTHSVFEKILFRGSSAILNLTPAQARNLEMSPSYGDSHFFDIRSDVKFTVIGAEDAGQIDAITLDLKNVDGRSSRPTALNSLDAAGVEILNLVASDDMALKTLASGSNRFTHINLSGVGSIDLTTGAYATDGLAIDGAAATGTVTIDAGAYAGSPSGGTGVAITGSSTTTNVLTGSAKADAIVGGAGADRISGVAVESAGLGGLLGWVTALSVSGGSDRLTGGGGSDTFYIGRIDALSHLSTITDLDLGTATRDGMVDKLILDVGGDAVAAARAVVLTDEQQDGVAGAASFAAAVDAALSVANTAHDVVRFAYGVDAYLVANGSGGGGSFDTADDVVLRITGSVGILDASDIVLI